MAVLLGSLQAADETRPESEMVTAGRHSKVSYGCNASGPFGSPRPCFHHFSFGYPLGFCICDGGWVAFVKTVAWPTTSLNHLPKYKHAYVHRLSPSAWRIPPLIGKKFRISIASASYAGMDRESMVTSVPLVTHMFRSNIPFHSFVSYGTDMKHTRAQQPLPKPLRTRLAGRTSRPILKREGDPVRPCNFPRKHYFPESPLKAAMSKINLHMIIKQFCMTVVPLGNDV